MVNASLRWQPERAWQWYREAEPVQGVNYLPRTAVNATEMWQRETFDPETIEQELSWAETYYNSLRVFLQFLVWQADPNGFKERLERFLALAHRHDMRVMPILFDDCAFGGKEPTLGPQENPIPGVHNSRWVPSPGPSRVVDPASWSQLRYYTQDVIGSFAEDTRVLAWDLYNEPGNAGMGLKSLPLAEAVFGWAREVGPNQPLTAGAWRPAAIPPEAHRLFGAVQTISERMIELSDVISFHSYERPENVTRELEVLQRGRPSLCTEWLKRQDDNTFEKILPIFRANNIGWYHWGLVAGRTQTYMPWGSKRGDPEPPIWQHDVFHSDGRPYDFDELAQLKRI